VSKLFAFVARPPGVAAHEFWARWERRLAAIEAERRVVNEAIAGASVPGLASSPFDGAIELWGAGDRAELDAAVAELSAPGAIVLRAQESVQFDRGFGAVKFIGLSRRSERFASREEWIRYWREVHGPLAHGLPEFTRYYGRYVHNYVEPGEPAFDGIVEEWVESVEAFAACLAEPAYLEHVRPDERLFVDFERSHMLITAEREIA